MQNKTTNFYINKKIKFYLIITLIVISQNLILAENSYKMSLEEVKVINDTTIEASIYIKNQGSELELTSYQCALSINQDIDLTKLELCYIEGTSELLNEPNLYVGIDNIDGPTELTFVSYIGHDIINKKTLIGKFQLKGNVDISKINLLKIKWDFDGTICTIITGDNFENITNPLNHTSILSSIADQFNIDKINILSSEASNVYGDKFTDEMLYDGITSSFNGGEYSSSDDGRWAVAGFPQWVTLDLGEETYVDHIMLDPYGSDIGITYDCEFYSGTFENRVLISKETTQTDTQWSNHSFSTLKTRFITIMVTGSNGNSWSDFWEIEVWGYNSTTSVNNEDLEEENFESDIIPDNYEISQNYPNPFNPSTKVEIRMKENSNARIDLFNILGEKVETIIDQYLSAGVHIIDINGSNLASGTYFYQLVVNNEFSQVRKMKLMK